MFFGVRRLVAALERHRVFSVSLGVNRWMGRGERRFALGAKSTDGTDVHRCFLKCGDPALSAPKGIAAFVHRWAFSPLGRVAEGSALRYPVMESGTRVPHAKDDTDATDVFSVSIGVIGGLPCGGLPRGGVGVQRRGVRFTLHGVSKRRQVFAFAQPRVAARQNLRHLRNLRFTCRFRRGKVSPSCPYTFPQQTH